MENIWQIAKYLEEEDSGYASISRLKQSDSEMKAQDKAEIAATLLSSFFPRYPLTIFRNIAIVDRKF